MPSGGNGGRRERKCRLVCVCVCVCVCKGASEIRTYWQVAARVVEATGKDNYNVIVNNGKDSGQEVCRLNPSSYTNFLIAKGR